MTVSNSLISAAQLACTQSDWIRAKRLFKAALQKKECRIAALHGLGVVSLQAKQPIRAVVLLERAQCLQNKEKSINLQLKEALLFALNTALSDSIRKQQWSRAIQIGRRSNDLKPNQANTLSNLAVAALRSNHLPQALTWSQQAIAHEPSNIKILNNHGTILQEFGDFENAKQIYKILLEKDPQHPSARSNLGCLEQQIGHLNKARFLYESHLHNYPDDTRVWVNLAGVLLSQNHWKAGWEAYQHRLDDPGKIMNVPKGLKLLQNLQEPVRQLVVVHEQGLGDSFQFSRFIPGLRKHLRHVVFSSPSKLHGLFRHSGLIDSCLDPDTPDFQWNEETLNAQDRWIPLMNLAPLLQEKQEINYFNEPYLSAESQSIQRWQKTLKQSDDPLIALHWQGNPDHEMTISRGRSIALQQLEPLLNIKGPQWLSLQKGPGSEQLDSLKWRHRFHPRQRDVDDCWDFQETAGILMNCDLVITSDSGLAHLAAGLGRPTWLLLMKVPEWRWGLEGSTTPWYPSMHLFRQEERHDWSGLINKQVIPALRHWLKQQQLF